MDFVRRSLGVGGWERAATYGTGILFRRGLLRIFTAYAAHCLALSPRGRGLPVRNWNSAQTRVRGVLLQRIRAFRAVEAAVGGERARIEEEGVHREGAARIKRMRGEEGDDALA